MLCINLKLLLYLTNCIILFFAVIFIVTGVHCLKIPGPRMNTASPSVVFGSLILVETLVGLIAYRMDQFFLKIIYLIFLICLFGGQVVFGIRSLATNEELTIRTFLRNAYATKPKDRIDRNILEFQKYFKCCGYSGPDGNEEQKPQNATYLIPECCQKPMAVCTKLNSYQQSCVDTMRKSHEEWGRMFGTIFLIASTVMIVEAVVAIHEMTDMY